MSNFSNSNSHLELVPDHRWVEVKSVPFAKARDLSLSNCCSISSLGHRHVQSPVKPHMVQTEHAQNDICTLECGLYLIQRRWITAVRRDTSFPAQFLLCRFQGLGLRSIENMFLTYYHGFSTFWRLLHDWWSQLPAGNLACVPFWAEQHIKALGFFLYYLFLCDFCWKISNGVLFRVLIHTTIL